MYIVINIYNIKNIYIKLKIYKYIYISLIFQKLKILLIIIIIIILFKIFYAFFFFFIVIFFF